MVLDDLEPVASGFLLSFSDCHSGLPLTAMRHRLTNDRRRYDITMSSNDRNRDDSTDTQLPAEIPTLADVLAGRVERPVHGLTGEYRREGGRLVTDGGEDTDDHDDLEPVSNTEDAESVREAIRHANADGAVTDGDLDDDSDDPIRVRVSNGSEIHHTDDRDADDPEGDLLVVESPTDPITGDGGHEATTQVGVRREIVSGEYVSAAAGTSRFDCYPIYTGLFETREGQLPEAIKQSDLSIYGHINGDEFECAPVIPIESVYHDCTMVGQQVYYGYEVTFAPISPDGAWDDEAYDYEVDP